MVGSRSNIEEKDNEALKVFFTDIVFNDFYTFCIKLKKLYKLNDLTKITE